MRDWLLSTLSSGRDLPEDAEGYLRGRGMTGAAIQRLGMGIWLCPKDPAPDEDFHKRYGQHGEYLEGRIVCPCYSPRGEVIGFEARTWRWEDGKKITDFRLPEANWNPFFLGLTPETMERIWNGGDVWVVEGLFDLAPLERVVPERDVVLATVRAKLSNSHIEFLRRYVRLGMVRMVYDNDETGRKQTHGWVDDTGKKRWGALGLLERVGVKCREMPYRGKDPGEIWDHGGEPALRAAFTPIA